LKYLAIALTLLSTPAVAETPSQVAFDIQAARTAQYAFMLCGIRSMEWWQTIASAVQNDLQQLPDDQQQAADDHINHDPYPKATVAGCQQADQSALMQQLDEFVIKQNNR
jgi:hypothetical protein